MSLAVERGLVLLLATLPRLLLSLWTAPHLGLTGDASYYHRLATRLAEGAGYTWLWPDGKATYAAHYPVGYPALLSLLYRAFGPLPALAALLNTALGVVGVAAIHELVRRRAGRRAALLAGLLAALDPAQIFYTPAPMTEGVTAALLAVAALLAALAAEPARKALPWLLASGAALGLATLIRPQCLLVAPLLGAAALGHRLASPDAPGAPRRLPAMARGALLVTAMTVLTCLPWTARNCARMNRCALVSVNGGWNLLIGAAPAGNGHWAPVDVPTECRTVFDEAGKDVCFGQAARRAIAAEPGPWLAKIPQKLAATFDYCGAGPWYLHDAAPGWFTYDDKVTAGAIETVAHRLLLIAAFLALGRLGGRVTRLGAALGIALSLLRPGWMAYVVLTLLAAHHGVRRRPGELVAASCAAVLGTTLLVHAVFFGAGRYSLVVFPLLSAVAGLLLAPRAAVGLLTGPAPGGDTGHHAPD